MRKKLREAARVISELEEELNNEIAHIKDALPSEVEATRARYGSMMLKRTAGMKTLTS